MVSIINILHLILLEFIISIFKVFIISDKTQQLKNSNNGFLKASIKHEQHILESSVLYKTVENWI